MIDPRLAILALPLLDRLGGWKFKPARRYGIPLFVYLISPSTEMAVLCIVMAAIFTFNLDEIEGYQDNASGDVAIGWEEVFLHGLGIGMCLYPLAGLTSLFPSHDRMGYAIARPIVRPLRASVYRHFWVL